MLAWSSLSVMTTSPRPTIEEITGLYRTHLRDLQRVRDEQRRIYRERATGSWYADGIYD